MIPADAPFLLAPGATWRIMRARRMPSLPPDTDPGSLDATDAHARRDRALTQRVERVEPDPAPLPPSPAAEQASRWLERERPRFDAPTEIAESSDTTRPLSTAAAPAVRVGHSTAFVALLAVTMLVVGMVVGGLLFGR